MISKITRRSLKKGFSGIIRTAVIGAAFAATGALRITAGEPSPPQPVYQPGTKSTAVPPDTQIKIEAKFFEITEDAWKKVSPEMRLETGLRTGDTDSTGPETLASQFPELKKEKQSYAELVREMTHGQDSPKKSESLPGWKIIEIIACEKRKALIKKLGHTEGCSLSSAPVATVKNGQESIAAITRKFRYPSAYGPDKKSPSRVSPTEFATKDIGVTLRVKPEIGPDGQTIDLYLVLESVALLGFIGDNGTTFAPPTQAEIQRVASPVFSTHTFKTSVSIWDHQTVLIGRVQLEVQAGKNGSDPRTVRKIMLTSVTAQLVDSSNPAKLIHPREGEEDTVQEIPSGPPMAGKPGL